MPTSYRPLVAFLVAQAPETVSITLTLSEIEALLGSPLSASAWTSTWWSNHAYHRPPRPWVRAGWRVSEAAVRSTPPTVTFMRAVSDSIT